MLVHQVFNLLNLVSSWGQGIKFTFLMLYVLNYHSSIWIMFCPRVVCNEPNISLDDLGSQAP